MEKRQRATAYGRVSTNSTEQAHSFENQSDYWNRKLAHDPKYEYVGLFADKGIENEIEQAFQTILQSLVGDMEQIKEILKDNVMQTLGEKEDNKGEEVLLELHSLQSEMIDINRKKRAGEIAYELYITRAREIADRIETLEEEQKQIQAAEENRITETKRLKDILEVIDQIAPTEKFDGELFRRLIENVIVKDRRLTFNFKVGISKNITI